MNKTSKHHVRTALFYLAVLVAARPSAIGQGVVHSQPATNGIYAEISMSTQEAALSSQVVRYCFLTTNESGAKIAYPKAEYLCRARLLDEHGSNMPPTALGRAVGNHFTDLKAFSRNKLETTGGRGSDLLRPRIEWIYKDSGAAKDFPAPGALFDIPKAGKYMLRLEFQVFEQVHRGTNFIYNLTIIPTVDVPVNKR